jgi:hypothetical protein
MSTRESARPGSMEDMLASGRQTTRGWCEKDPGILRDVHRASCV